MRFGGQLPRRLQALGVALLLTAAAAAAVAAERPRGPSELVVVVGGDVMAGRWVGDRWVDRSGPRPLHAVAHWLAGADLAVANLETPLLLPDRRADCLARRSAAARPRAVTLVAHPDLARRLAAVGLDALSLANNHALDCGPRALLDTVEHLRRADVAALGVHADGPPLQPHRLRLAGVTVSLFAATDRRGRRLAPAAARRLIDGGSFAWLEQTLPARVAHERERGAADVVLVSLHWGQELAPAPSARQRRLARRLVAAGAQAVLGHHPHTVQPVEALPTGVVAYSLGNLLFDQRASSAAVGALAELRLAQQPEGGWLVTRVELLPLRVRPAGTSPGSPESLAAVAARSRVAFDTPLTRSARGWVWQAPAASRHSRAR